MQSALKNIIIILCNTSHNGNIGSAARAMKTMDIHNLVLVDPIALPDDHSLALACNAADIVKKIQIVKTLDEALIDCTIAVGMTSRKREFASHLNTPKEIVPEILDQINNHNKIAIVFGSEKNGLTIEQLEKCNRVVTIPGNPEYFSLNLAQAVQIMCYEIYSNYNPSIEPLKQIKNISSISDNQGILEHINQILIKSNFYNNKNQKQTQRRIQNILHKAQLERQDVDLIRGMLKHFE